MSAGLPTASTFITKLINSLSAHAHPHPSADHGATPTLNPLDIVPEEAKEQLLTLHVLFPNEFLPALDLLDRRLVTRFRIHRNDLCTDDEDMTASKLRGANGAETCTTVTRGGVDVGCENAGNAAVARALHDEAHAGGETGGETSALNIIPPTAAAQQTHTPDDVEMLDRGSPVPRSEAHPLVPETTEDSAQDSTRLPQNQLLTPTAPTALQDAEARLAPEDGLGCPTAQQPHIHVRGDADTVYYVRSAQARSSRFNTSYDSTTHYEVRLKAWNCSCPAFAFAAFPALLNDPPLPFLDLDSDSDLLGQMPLNAESGASRSYSGAQDDTWRFGGISLGDGLPPVCKHLLACVLMEHCGIFNAYMEERRVSVEEAAGWAAGWGD